jgi:hypothetical protein
MTRADWLRLGSMLVIIIAGIVLITVPFRPVKDIVKLGLDLQGGVRLVLEGEGVSAMAADAQTETIGRMIEILTAFSSTSPVPPIRKRRAASSAKRRCWSSVASSTSGSRRPTTSPLPRAARSFCTARKAFRSSWIVRSC